MNLVQAGDARVDAHDGDATVLDREPRCSRCHKKLAEYLARPWLIICVRCKAPNGYRGESPEGATLDPAAQHGTVASVPNVPKVAPGS